MAYKKNYDKKSYEEKRKANQERVDLLFKQLEEGSKAFLTSEKYKEFLDYMSKFRTYSVNNCMLIAMQLPSASLVAGYEQWKTVGRYTKKGEKALRILAPVMSKKSSVKAEKDKPTEYNDDGTEVKNEPKEDEKVLVGYRAVPVFDVSQTDGKPLPEMTGRLKETVTKEYADVVSAALDNLTGIKHEFEEMEYSQKGYCSYGEKRIVLNLELNANEQIKTHIHETAHWFLHGKGMEEENRKKNEREIQAESVAYVVSKRLGLDTSEYSFPYVAGWREKNQKEIFSLLDNTKKVIEKIDREVEKALYECMKKDISKSEDMQKTEDLQSEVEFSETEKREAIKNVPEKIALDVQKIEIMDSDSKGFKWTYFEPKKYGENGAFVEMNISNDVISQACAERFKVMRVCGFDKGNEVFLNIIQEKSNKNIIKNNGTDTFKEFKENFMSENHDLSFDGKTFAAADSYLMAKIIEDMEKCNEIMRKSIKKEYSAWYCPIKKSEAAVMWQNGFDVLNSSGKPLPKYVEGEKNDFSPIESSKDFKLFTLHKERKMQQLFDEIADCAETLSIFESSALYNVYEDYDWHNYDDEISVAENVQSALGKRNYKPLARYLYDTVRENYSENEFENESSEIYKIANQATQAMSELVQEFKQEEAHRENQEKEVNEVVKSYESSGRGR